MDCMFYSINEVAEILDVSHNTAERIVRQMNKKMASEGYNTITGRINKGYFWDSIYTSERHDYYEKVGF